MSREEILERLRSHVVGHIHREALRTGARLPSMRELADRWGVHVRLVRTAYETLKREGLVELRPRSGVYVGGVPAGVIAGDPEIGDSLVGTLIRARASGVPPVEWPDRMSRYLQTRRLRAACVEANEDQISWLVYESQRDYGLDAFGVDLDDLDQAELARCIRASDMVISTAFHGEVLESVARAERKPIVLLRLAGDFVESVTAALRRDRLYFVVGDRRFAVRLPIIYGGVDGGKNLHPLVAGEDDLGAIPPGAAVYVTRAAESRLDSAAALRTVSPPGRIFADSMATDLLRIIVGYNIVAMRRASAGPTSGSRNAGAAETAPSDGEATRAIPATTRPPSGRIPTARGRRAT